MELLEVQDCGGGTLQGQ
uniref:Uncharacterized protein n=1 Tax=Arundo donax TaxID=35708 RepID=A0A0A9FKX4_ARUDO